MKTITVKVLLVERFEPPKEWTLVIPGEMSRGEAADLIFRLSNFPTHALTDEEREILAKYPRTGLRSVSVGDILIIEDAENDTRHFATVDRFGFKFH